MIAEALLWTGLAVAAPAVAGLFSAQLTTRLADRSPSAATVGRWICSLGIPYVALITGAVSVRDVGLTGMTGAEWLRGAIVCIAALGAAWIMSGWRRFAWAYARPEQAAMDEPRWALFRGTASQVVDPGLAGPLMGLGIGLLEWFIHMQPWAGRRRPMPVEWTDLARVCLSTALFLLTRNLWLIVPTQVGVSLILTNPSQAATEDDA